MSGGMQVHLLRHGEAAAQSPDGTSDDEARELTSDGISRLSAACRVYSRVVGQPRRIVHSTLRRARQSADILAMAIGARDRMSESTELRPGGRASRILDLLQTEFLDGCESLVLVGHEPLLGDLLGLLATGNERMSMPMGKGMLATVQLNEPQVMIGRLTVILSQATAIRLDSVDSVDNVD